MFQHLKPFFMEQIMPKTPSWETLVKKANAYRNQHSYTKPTNKPLPRKADFRPNHEVLNEYLPKWRLEISTAIKNGFDGIDVFFPSDICCHQCFLEDLNRALPEPFYARDVGTGGNWYNLRISWRDLS